MRYVCLRIVCNSLTRYKKLVYEVCDIEVVLPEETQILGAEPDRDLVTLLTCTPYGKIRTGFL